MTGRGRSRVPTDGGPGPPTKPAPGTARTRPDWPLVVAYADDS